MNGKQAKFLRRSAAFITDLPTSYVNLHHRKKGMFPEINEKGEVTKLVEKEYMVGQTKLGNCTRQIYQLMKRKQRKSYAA